MMIGNLGALCPEKRSTIVEVAVRALISGSIICFMNASIAGTLKTFFSVFIFSPSEKQQQTKTKKKPKIFSFDLTENLIYKYVPNELQIYLKVLSSVE